jgi:hypothetical protein
MVTGDAAMRQARGSEIRNSSCPAAQKIMSLRRKMGRTVSSEAVAILQLIPKNDKL